MSIVSLVYIYVSHTVKRHLWSTRLNYTVYTVESVRVTYVKYHALKAIFSHSSTAFYIKSTEVSTKLCQMLRYLMVHLRSVSFRRRLSFIISLTLYGHIKTAEQRTIIQQYCDWYTAGRWWMGCYIWYSEEGPGRGGLGPRPVSSSLYQM